MNNKKIKTRHPTPHPAPTTFNRTSSIGQFIKEGFAWGLGSSVAKNIFGNQEKVIPIKKEELKKEELKKEENLKEEYIFSKYNKCIEESNDYEKCNKILG